MNFKGIDNWSFKYQLTRFYVNFAHNVIFYRKVVITGKENIPDNTPLFFAPNHQNALMDALIILCNIKQQPVFIARADIFKNPFIAKILILFKILPAYRIRDGKENLGKNEEIFDISVNILENKHILTLFPETTHTDKRRLQTLKKGIQRIVFQAEEKNNFELGVKVIPIGINYSSYWNFRSDILINFGKPIELNEFKALYKENPQKAMLDLRDRLTDALLPLIINIPSVEYYDLYDFLRKEYNEQMLEKLNLKATLYDKFNAEKEIIAALNRTENEIPEKMGELDQKVKEYREILKKQNIRDWLVRKEPASIFLFLKSIILLFGLPVFIYGWINHMFPYYLPNPIRKKIKDRQFMSSVNYVTGLVLYPLFYLIQFILVWAFTDIWWIKFIYLITLPVSGLTAFHLHRLYIKVKAQWKFFFSKRLPWLNRLKQLRNDIDGIMNTIINIHLTSRK